MMKMDRKTLVIGGVTLGLVGLVSLTNVKAETKETKEYSYEYLYNYHQLNRALENMEQEDEDWRVLNHDLIRIEGDQWLWTYVVYDSYLEETCTARIAFDNGITECLWADIVDEDGYREVDPEDVDMEELYEYME